MSKFNDAFEYVMEWEGGLSENANDAGGTTNFGISVRFLRTLETERLRRYGIFEPISDETVRNLTKDQARSIYYDEFWIVNKLDEIDNKMLTIYIFDMVVNMGAGQAIKMVQRACCAASFRRNCLKDDGIIGEETLTIVNGLLERLLPILIAARVEFYRGLAQKDGLNFLNGWLNRAYMGG